MKNQIKLIATLSAVVSLLATIIVTPAMAQNRVITIAPVIIVASPKPVVNCTTRALDIGSGSVRICG